MATTLLRNVKEVATDLYKALKRTLGFNVDKNQKYDYSTFKDLGKKLIRNMKEINQMILNCDIISIRNYLYFLDGGKYEKFK